MKILCFADYHLGTKVYGRIDPITGLNTRELQTLGVLDEIVDYAINNNIEVIIAAGDMYKNNLPTPTLQNEFNKRLKRASDANITVLLLDGNHDVSKMETTTSALKSFDTFDIQNVVHTRFHKEFVHNGIKYVFLPTYHTREQIEEIVTNTTYDIPTIFIGHMSVQGALMNDWLIAEKEIYIDHKIFNQPNVLAVVMGHLHKHQVLSEWPLVFYTGSTQRIDFNEEKQPKGFVVLDIKGKTVNYEYIEIESQKFLTIKLNLVGTDNPTKMVLDEITTKTQKIKDAIVRIKLDVDETIKLDERKIYESIYNLGASTVLDIQKSFEQQKVVKEAELNEHISIEKGLELYYKDKPRSKERIQLGKEIIKKINEE